MMSREQKRMRESGSMQANHKSRVPSRICKKPAFLKALQMEYACTEAWGGTVPFNHSQSGVTAV